MGDEPETDVVAKGSDPESGTPEVREDGVPHYRVELPVFEGPLDLLLHLIQQHELDIFDIPIAFITQKYVEYVTLMEDLNIDVASEYLVMAATLTHIKSKMLLPASPDDEEDEEDVEMDPRAELVRRLLEYQKYKEAAAQLSERSILGRDVFLRGAPAPAVDGPAPLAPLGLFKLLDAFQAVLKRAKQGADHQIDVDRFSISDRINELSDLLRGRGRVRFEELFNEEQSRADLIVTFLALLEMTRVRLIRLMQEGPLAPISIELAVTDDDDSDDLEDATRYASRAEASEHATAAASDRVQSPDERAPEFEDSRLESLAQDAAHDAVALDSEHDEPPAADERGTEPRSLQPFDAALKATHEAQSAASNLAGEPAEPRRGEASAPGVAGLGVLEPEAQPDTSLVGDIAALDSAAAHQQDVWKTEQALPGEATEPEQAPADEATEFEQALPGEATEPEQAPADEATEPEQALPGEATEPEHVLADEADPEQVLADEATDPEQVPGTSRAPADERANTFTRSAHEVGKEAAPAPGRDPRQASADLSDDTETD